MAITIRVGTEADNPKIHDLVSKITMPGPAEMCFQRLPDFFIGAHAAVEGWPILTRDPRKYRQYFPTVELVTP